MISEAVNGVFFSRSGDARLAGGPGLPKKHAKIRNNESM